MNTRPYNLSNALSTPNCFAWVVLAAVFLTLANHAHTQAAADTPEEPQPAAPATAEDSDATPAPSDSPATPPEQSAPLPQASVNLQQALTEAIAAAERLGLDSREKLPPITLIENLATAPEKISLDPTGASSLLKATITPRPGKWEIFVAKKLAATVSYKRSSKALELTLTPSQTLYCLRFLRLQVMTKDNGTVPIELGSPLDVTFAITAKRPNVLSLFDDDEANALLAKLLLLFESPAFKDTAICESIRFSEDSELRCYTRVSSDLPAYMKNLPAGRLVLMRADEDDEAGVVLTRLAGGTAEYARDNDNFVVNPQKIAVEIDGVIGFPESDWICNRETAPKFSIAADTTMKRTRTFVERQQVRNADIGIQSLLEVAGKGAGRLLTADAPRRRAVRFELVPPASDEGIVLVDSLRTKDSAP